MGKLPHFHGHGQMNTIILASPFHILTAKYIPFIVTRHIMPSPAEILAGKVAEIYDEEGYYRSEYPFFCLERIKDPTSGQLMLVCRSCYIIICKDDDFETSNSMLRGIELIYHCDGVILKPSDCSALLSKVDYTHTKCCKSMKNDDVLVDVLLDSARAKGEPIPSEDLLWIKDPDIDELLAKLSPPPHKMQSQDSFSTEQTSEDEVDVDLIEKKLSAIFFGEDDSPSNAEKVVGDSPDKSDKMMQGASNVSGFQMSHVQDEMGSGVSEIPSNDPQSLFEVIEPETGSLHVPGNEAVGGHVVKLSKAQKRRIKKNLPIQGAVSFSYVLTQKEEKEISTRINELISTKEGLMIESSSGYSLLATTLPVTLKMIGLVEVIMKGSTQYIDSIQKLKVRLTSKEEEISETNQTLMKAGGNRELVDELKIKYSNLNDERYELDVELGGLFESLKRVSNLNSQLIAIESFELKGHVAKDEIVTSLHYITQSLSTIFAIQIKSDRRMSYEYGEPIDLDILEISKVTGIFKGLLRSGVKYINAAVEVGKVDFALKKLSVGSSQKKKAEVQLKSLKESMNLRHEAYIQLIRGQNVVGLISTIIAEIEKDREVEGESQFEEISSSLEKVKSSLAVMITLD